MSKRIVYLFETEFYRVVCLESSQTRSNNEAGVSEEYHDLYTLAGHEASY
jgi:hypothetical protein